MRNEYPESKTTVLPIFVIRLSILSPPPRTVNFLMIKEKNITSVLADYNVKKLSNWNVFIKKTPGPNKFIWQIIPNIWRTENLNLKQTFPETQKRRKWLNLLYETIIILILKIRKAKYTKENYMLLTLMIIVSKILTEIF